MQHFAKAINKNIDTDMINVQVNSKDQNMKQLGSLEKQLKLLNENLKNQNNTFIAIPALATVPLLNLQDQIKAVTGKNLKLTPQNIKANKLTILEFLKTIYDNPDKYRKYIDYMDPLKQGIEHTYGIIREINKMKTQNVYVPAGHPHNETLKWLAGQRGLKPELYNYISTGIDIDNSVHLMTDEIKNKGWYDFNLLGLSNANVVNVKSTNGTQDYMFAAYDTCINDGARGVYNFSPIRKDGKLIGYSYIDTITNQYPYDEFPANEEISNIVKFVGLNADMIVASRAETENFIKTYKGNGNLSAFGDKLYPVQYIFTPGEIQKQKINLKGDYVDSSLKLFFRKNDDNKIVFPNCDCEGCGRPSVLSMWGSCFAIFNAISRDINYKLSGGQHLSSNIMHNNVSWIFKDGIISEKTNNYDAAKNRYNEIIELCKANTLKDEANVYSTLAYESLGNLCFKLKEYNEAAEYYNIVLNNLCRDYNSTYFDIKELFYPKDNSLNNQRKYNNLIAQLFNKLAVICNDKDEEYPATVCKWAAKEVLNCTSIADKIIARRADNDNYIGDIYNENN